MCEDICEEAFQKLLKSCVSFGEGLDGFNEEKRGGWEILLVLSGGL